MKRNTRFAVTVLFAALVASGLIACEDIGEEGNFSFGDETEYGEWDLFNGGLSPLTVGATVEVEVEEVGATSDEEEDGTPVTLSSATSTDTGVFSVDTVDGNRISLTGVAPGSAFLEVEAADGTTDRVEVTVEEAADFEIRLSTGAPLIQDLPDSQTWMLRRGIEVPVSARGRTENDTPMTGVGAETWTIAVDGGDSITPGNAVDGWDIVQTENGHANIVVGDVGDTVSINAGGQTSVDLGVVADDAIASIELVPWISNPVGDALMVGRYTVYSIAAYTETGEYILGREGFTVAVDGDAAELDEEPGDLEDYLTGLHGTFAVDGLSEGTVDVVVTYGEMEERLTITVVAEQEEGES